MPDVGAEGYLWLSLILGPLVLGTVTVLLSLPDSGLRPGVRLGCAIAAVIMGLAVITLFWVRSGSFGCFGVLGTAVAVLGGRNIGDAYRGIQRGERPLTPAENHVRSVAWKVYDDLIEESKLTFRNGVAYLELRLTAWAPLREVRIDLTSLADKHRAGLSDLVLERAIDMRPDSVAQASTEETLPPDRQGLQE